MNMNIGEFAQVIELFCPALSHEQDTTIKNTFFGK